MAYLNGNAVIGQSGNATTVINASAVGVIEALRNKFSPKQKIYASPFGIKGALKEELIDTSFLSDPDLERIAYSSGSIFGQTRFQIKFNPEKHKPEEVKRGREYVKRLFKVFDAHNIRYFFYEGGGDSMDTADKINKMAEDVGYELVVVGVPKTIDNDLEGPKYDPGYLSAAKIVSSVAMSLNRRIIAEMANNKSGGVKTRSMRLADLANQYAFMGSDVDLESARKIGKYAADKAVNGKMDGKMATMGDPLDNATLGSIALAEVANVERQVPEEWIDQEEGTVHLGPIEEYLKPIESELFLPRSRVEFFNLDLTKHLVEKKLPEYKP